MKKILTIILISFSTVLHAIPCDCEVRIYPLMTASNHLKPNTLKTYTLEEFSSYSFKNQNICRNSCLEKFEEDMPVNRLHSLLLVYGKSLIDQKVLGYNCTGLTTMKFPVRVKASLGDLGLGNVSDTIEVVTHEELCF